MNPLAHARRWMQPLHALLLAALLLFAQGQGLAHHVVHGQGSSAAHTPEWLDGHEEGSAECRLVDQLGHADLALGTAASLPAVPVAEAAPAAQPAPAPGCTLALAYRARAPPQATTARA